LISSPNVIFGFRSHLRNSNYYFSDFAATCEIRNLVSIFTHALVFLFLKEKFIQTCFLDKDALPTCTRWQRCPSRKFYLSLQIVFKKLYESLSEIGDHSVFPSCPYEETLELFKPAHLDYILLREFQKKRGGEEVGDLPIVWATTGWRQTHHPRKAILIRFEPTVELNALPEILDPEVQIIIARPELLPMTKDFFWQTVSGAHLTISLQMVLALRLLLHAICFAHRNQTGITLTHNFMANFYTGKKITPEVTACMFWDDREKMINFFKNRLFHKKRKRNMDPEPLNVELSLKQLKTRLENNKNSKIAWDAVFKHVDYAQVERVYEAALAMRLEPDLPEFPLFAAPGSATCHAIDSHLSHSDYPLAPACSKAAKEGSLTIKLIKGLAKLRVNWQNNRLAFGTKYLDLAVPPVVADYGTNTKLAGANKLPTLQARMTLTKEGARVPRSVAVENLQPIFGENAEALDYAML
jgi:hypothetical protein